MKNKLFKLLIVLLLICIPVGINAGKVFDIWTGFQAGELSSYLDGQVGLAEYRFGAKTMTNFIPHVQGPVSNRPGFRYIATAKTSTAKSRLIPFEFSTEQAYILEFSPSFIRYYMNDGQIQDLDANTMLMLSMNGTDASTTFTDDSPTTPHTVTANGNAQLDTEYKKFGSASGLFDETGDYLTIPDNADFDLSGGIWTIDLWTKSDLSTINHSLSYVLYYKETDGNNYNALTLNGVSISTQDALSRGIFFKPDGLKMYEIGSDSDKVYQYTLSSAWDLSTGTYDSVSISTQDNDSSGIFFKPDGTKMYEVGTNSDKAYQYTLSSAWDLSTATYDSVSISTQDSAPTGIFFKPDGLKMYEIDRNSDKVYQYTLSSAWDLSTATYDSVSISTQDSASSGIFFKPDGLKMYEIGYGSDKAYQYTLSSAWDLSTATYDSVSISTQDAASTGIFFKPDGLKMYEIGGTSGKVYQYTLSSAWDLSTGSPDLQVHYQIVASGTAVVDIYSVGYGLSWWKSDFRHIAAMENGNNYYLAVEGTVNTISDTDRAVPYTGGVSIGGGGTLADYNGWMDELRVSDSIRWTADFTPEITEYIVSDAGGTPYQTSTTYTEAELPELQYVQSADTLYIVHPSHAPATLTRTGHTSWTLANISFNDAPASWGVGSYPSAIAFFENRLWFGYFQTLWASKSGDYDNMDPLNAGGCGTAAACALQYTIASNNVNEIQWLSSGKILVVGTSGGEYKISASSQDEAITPANVRIVKQSSYGSDNVMPLTIRDVTLYLQRAGRKVREFAYQFESDIYVSPDLTLLAEHITESGIKYMDYQANPDSIVWAVREDGDLIGLTYARDYDTIAWHRHTTDGSFESVAVIPDTSGTDTDEVWVIVKRDIDGSTVRYVEQLQPRFDHNDSIEDAFFVDSGLSYDGVSTSTISGLDHLEGETVAILADGLVQTSKTVSSGSITLDTAATKVHAGLSYTSTLQTMRWVGNSEIGTMQGQKKRINSIVLRTENAKQFKYGHEPTPAGKLKEKTFTSLYTGDTMLQMPNGVNREGYVSILQYKPLPLTVTAIIAEINW